MMDKTMRILKEISRKLLGNKEDKDSGFSFEINKIVVQKDLGWRVRSISKKNETCYFAVICKIKQENFSIWASIFLFKTTHSLWKMKTITRQVYSALK